MPLNQLTITLARDGHVSAETLRDTLEQALVMLRGLEEDFVNSNTSIRWEIVRVRMRSPLQMTIAPVVQGGEKPHAVGRQIISSCLKGVEGIEHEAVLPAHFNEDSLRATQRMVTIAQNDGASVTFSNNGKNKVPVTQRVAENIALIISKDRRYTDHGTIEGRLEEISVHGAPHLRIWDPIPKEHSIRCIIQPDGLQQAKDLLGHRIAVTGAVHYRNHTPTQIDVEEIRRLRTEDELPQPETMEPIDITGGLSAEEYIRRMRDAQ